MYQTKYCLRLHQMLEICCRPHAQWVDDQEVIWEKPRGKARGIFLALNGCNHGADGWWDAQPACKDCLGARAVPSNALD